MNANRRRNRYVDANSQLSVYKCTLTHTKRAARFKRRVRDIRLTLSPRFEHTCGVTALRFWSPRDTMRSAGLGGSLVQLASSRVNFWPRSTPQFKYRIYPAGADWKRKAGSDDERRLCVEVLCQQKHTQPIQAGLSVNVRRKRRLMKFHLFCLFLNMINLQRLFWRVWGCSPKLRQFHSPSHDIRHIGKRKTVKFSIHNHRCSDQRCFHEFDGFIFEICIMCAFHQNFMAGVCCNLFCHGLSCFVGSNLCFDHECDNRWTQSNIWQKNRQGERVYQS